MAEGAGQRDGKTVHRGTILFLFILLTSVACGNCRRAILGTWEIRSVTVGGQDMNLSDACCKLLTYRKDGSLTTVRRASRSLRGSANGVIASSIGITFASKSRETPTLLRSRSRATT